MVVTHTAIAVGMSRKRIAGVVGLSALALLGLIQLVPYGRNHSNSPVTRAARWPNRTGEQLAEQACYDCHSNLTDWPWYSNLAPVSWLVQNDVDGGRSALNFSEWDRPQPDVHAVVDKVVGGGMPPWQYKLIHASARLSKAERMRLAGQIAKLYAQDPPPRGN